jgi:hypothetical protein
MLPAIHQLRPATLLICLLMVLNPVPGVSQDAPRAEGVYPTVAALNALTPGAWTMVVFPDTQYYVDHSRSIPPTPEIFQTMVNWTIAQRESRNIQLMLHVGDIVDNNTAQEWAMARDILAPLNGQLPWAFTSGNHEYTGNAEVRETKLNSYLSAEDNALNDPARGGILVETMQPGQMENACYRFRAPDGRTLMIMALEWGVRDAVIDWANTVLSRPENSDVTTILLVHAYLYHNNTRYDWDGYGKRQSGNPHAYGTARTGDTNDGRQLWNKLVRRHRSIELVLCGHVSGTVEERYALGDRSEVGYLSSVGDHGQVVHQLLFNAQRRGDSGEGWLRLLEFQPDGESVIVKTYSPWLDQRKLTCWRSDDDDYFTLRLSPVRRAE